MKRLLLLTLILTGCSQTVPVDPEPAQVCVFGIELPQVEPVGPTIDPLLRCEIEQAMKLGDRRAMDRLMDQLRAEVSS